MRRAERSGGKSGGWSSGEGNGWVCGGAGGARRTRAVLLGAARGAPGGGARCSWARRAVLLRAARGALEAVRGAPGQIYSGRFMLVDDHDGAPLANREYAVVRASGKLEFGTSDRKGQTHLLSATAQPESVEIYAQGPMRTTSLISPSGAVLHFRGRRRTASSAEMLVKEIRLEVDESAPASLATVSTRDAKARLAPDALPVASERPA